MASQEDLKIPDETVPVVALPPPAESSCADSGCIHCRLDHPFDLPGELVDHALKHDLVIFAGAGISTEVPEVFPTTVLEMATARLGLDGQHEFSFPEVMEQFQARFGRTELVQMIKRKFDYIDCYPFLRNTARQFHYELATMLYLSEVVTTNWDTYFEEECGAIPIVTGQDIAFYGLPGRKVLKIHGSISQVGSVVATETDYAKRLDQLGSDLMGGLLRSVLATKTVVFVGYSLTDWNFRRLYEALRGDMAPFAPVAYVVDPFARAEVNEYGMHVLKTSGVKFLRDLKKACVGPCAIEDTVFGPLDGLWEELLECDQIAKTVSVKEYPAVLFTWFYHDGMRDALSRITHRMSTGEFSERHTVLAKLRTYDQLQDRMESEGRWDPYAYIDGCINVLLLLLDDSYGRAIDADGEAEERNSSMLESLPRYFVYGANSPMRTEEDFRAALKASRRRSPKTRRFARDATKDFPDGMVTHHEPFLPFVDAE